MVRVSHLIFVSATLHGSETNVKNRQTNQRQHLVRQCPFVMVSLQMIVDLAQETVNVK